MTKQKRDKDRNNQTLGRMRGFKFLTGDMNYATHGGAFYRRVSPTLYHVIGLTNLAEAGVLEEGSTDTYDVTLFLVDLQQTEANYRSAFDCVGMSAEDVEAASLETASLMRLDALYQYGLRGPLESFQGPNYTKLMTAAKHASHRLEDPVEHGIALNRVVNRIGQTVEEVMRGADTNDAIARALGREPMHPDPLAYMVGYLDGKDGRRSGEEGLADGYLAGYARGLDVTAGAAPAPSWIHVVNKA
jgi:hypothetical protein